MTVSRGGFNRYEQLTHCRLARVSNLAGTYSNGQTNNGVGATLSATSAAVLTIDSVNVAAGDSILLQSQTNTFENGIYFVVNPGSASALWILQRRNDFQSPEQMVPGMFVPISAGTVNAGFHYTLVEPVVSVVGTDAITFIKV